MSANLSSIIKIFQPYIPIIEIIIILIISFIILRIISTILKRYLIKKVKTKKQISNISSFIDLLNFIFLIFLILIAVTYYYGNLGELGFIAGLLTVAIGWALQKPISGVVAWLILIIKKPITIGDRVTISNIKGDITNITLTHIFLNEIGGTVEGEEKSGRTIMLPTSIIFDQEVINYTEKDEFILDEVTTAITYESNLEKAEQITLESVKKIMISYWVDFPKKIYKEPHNRLKFKDSGIDLKVRFQSIAKKRNQITTDITREIFNRIRNTDDVEIAYPHTEVLFRNKKI